MVIYDKNYFDALLRQSFSAFIEKAFYIVTGGEPYHHNWHIDLIAQHLELCFQGKIKRLIITLPPRYLKSICVSVAFPAWVLGHNPSMKIIATSYAQELSTKHSLDCRRLMESEIYKRVFPTTRILSSKNTQTEYQTTRGGFRLATSVGGTLTGRGGDILIIDDPLKPQEALSDLSRENVNDWYDNTFYSRLNDKNNGCIIIIMQRLHDNDLIGHVLNHEEWVHLNFPALAETEETHIVKPQWIKPYKIIRNPGDALHPERESKEKLENLRTKILGNHHFSAQYQQSPVPMGGGLIKFSWFQKYLILPQETLLRIIQSWDTASKTDEVHDYSVCMTWYEYKNGWYLVDVFRERLEFPDLQRAVASQASKYSPHYILIEDKGSGTQLIQDLYRNTNLPIKGVIPEGDKATRMLGQTPKIETGKVFIPENVSWLSDFEYEVLRFPKGKHNDQIDSMSQALKWFSDNPYIDPNKFFDLSETPDEYKPDTYLFGKDIPLW